MKGAQAFLLHSASFPAAAFLLIFLILTASRKLQQVASKLPSVVPTSKCAAQKMLRDALAVPVPLNMLISALCIGVVFAC